MFLEPGQVISLWTNGGILLIGIVLTILILWKLKLGNKNNKLLFLLFMMYWIGPLMTRDYTGLIQLSFGMEDGGILLIWPLVIYGLIGLIWRPLSDVFSFRFKSRKNVLYLSLALQIVCIIPMLIKPCFATNMIQSTGAGIGASCIGLFNLMFNEHDARRKTLSVVSILALPPILAQFFASGLMSMITTFETSFDTKEEFVGILWWMWIAALIFAIVCVVMTIFVQEKQETLYRNNVVKEPVKTKHEYWALTLVCIMAMCTTLIRWATAGPTASIQIAYLGLIRSTDTRFYEGYGSLIHTIGQLVGVILTSMLMKAPSEKRKMILVGVSTGCCLIYLMITATFTTIPVFMGMNIINGFSYGIVYTIFMGIALNKFFTKQEKITPVGICNFFLSLGICLGNVIHCLFKAKLFDQIRGFSTLGEKEFIYLNGMVNAVCVIFALLLLGSYIGYVVIEKKHPPGTMTRKSHWAKIRDTEL